MLNLASYIHSPDHSTIGTRSHIDVLSVLVSTRFQVLFHSPPGVLFTFPSRYWFTIGHYLVFSLTQWSALIPTKFHVLRRTLDPASCILTFRLLDFHRLWYVIQTFRLSQRITRRGPNPILLWFGLLPFRSPLLRESILFLFL